MNNNMNSEGFRPNEEKRPILEPNDDGSFDMFELGDSIKEAGDEIRKNNPKIDTALKIAENPAFDPILEDMVSYLRQLHSDFNWKAYVDLIKEKRPTLN